MTLSILGILSLVYIVIKTIIRDKNINSLAIYLSHIGFIITLFGVLAIFIDENVFQQEYGDFHYAIYSFGVVAAIPYLHIMVLHRFFR